MGHRLRALTVAILVGCGDDSEPAQGGDSSPATAPDEDGDGSVAESGTTLDPGDCDAFLGCAKLCDVDDFDCREECGHITGAIAGECTYRHCNDLIDWCGQGNEMACEELLSFCSSPEYTTGSDSESGSTDTGGSDETGGTSGEVSTSSTSSETGTTDGGSSTT